MSVTLLIKADSKADIYARDTPSPTESMLVLWDTVAGDIPPSVWLWNASSSASDNFTGGVVKPTNTVGNGRWLRQLAWPTPSSGTVTSVTAGTGLSGGTITSSGTISMPNVGTAGSYHTLTTDAQGRVSAGDNPSSSAVTRSITGTTYTPSTTRWARVYYTIRITCTATIGSASSGLVLFQYSTDGGSNWIDGPEVQNSNTVTLAVALNSVTIQTGVIAFEVPPNALCRMTQTSSGTTTITYVRGREVLD